MKLRRIGAPVSIGCDLPGAETAIRSLQANGIVFDDIIDVKTLPENKNEILHYGFVALCMLRVAK